MPTTTATSAAGTRGAHRRSTSIPASVAPPTTSVGRCVTPSEETTCTLLAIALPPPPWIPSSAGTWPTMIVRASPITNPRSTGAEMKDATNPSRSRPATTATAPTTTASAAVSATGSLPPRAARSATTVADSAAVADIGATTRCRDVPSRA